MYQMKNEEALKAIEEMMNWSKTSEQYVSMLVLRDMILDRIQTGLKPVEKKD
jgi:hypothetical protein